MGDESKNALSYVGLALLSYRCVAKRMSAIWTTANRTSNRLSFAVGLTARLHESADISIWGPPRAWLSTTFKQSNRDLRSELSPSLAFITTQLNRCCCCCCLLLLLALQKLSYVVILNRIESYSRMVKFHFNCGPN